MKSYPSSLLKSLRHFQAIGVLVGAFALVALPARAQTNGTWELTTGGAVNWGTDTNWVSNSIADGAGATANFSSANLGADTTVTLDTSRTVGTLTIGDPTVTTYKYTIAPGTGTSLTFDSNGGGGALLSKSAGGANDTISVPIILSDNLTVRKTANGTLTISGGITSTGGTRNLVLENNTGSTLSVNTEAINNVGSITNSGTGSGQVILNAAIGANVTGITQNSSNAANIMTLGAANTAFTGDVFVQSATLTVNLATGLNSSNTVSVSGGTFNVGGTTTTALTIAGLNGSGGVVQGASATQVRTLDFGGSGTYSYGGVIQDRSTGTGGITHITKSVGGTQTLSGVNTYTGNTTVTSGTLVLASTGELTFMIGNDGVTNSILGGGTLTLDGKFNFDLSTAAATGSWNIVNVGTLAATFGASFSVNGFTDAGSNTWTKVNGPSTYTFDESTGLLSAIPEPGTWALLAFSLTTVLVLRRRRNS